MFSECSDFVICKQPDKFEQTLLILLDEHLFITLKEPCRNIPVRVGDEGMRRGLSTAE